MNRKFVPFLSFLYNFSSYFCPIVEKNKSMNLLKFFQKHAIIANLLLAIVIISGLIVGLLIWLDAYTRHGESVNVPDVKGLRVEEAAVFFQNKSLNYIVTDSIYVKNGKSGIILETIPPVGTAVKTKRTVFLTISSSVAQVFSIPDVIDMSQRQAISLLHSTGFENVQVKIVPGAFLDLVLGLETPFGKKLTVGDKVLSNTSLILLVSSGTEEDSFEIGLEKPSEEIEDSWF